MLVSKKATLLMWVSFEAEFTMPGERNYRSVRRHSCVISKEEPVRVRLGAFSTTQGPDVIESMQVLPAPSADGWIDLKKGRALKFIFRGHIPKHTMITVGMAVEK